MYTIATLNLNRQLLKIVRVGISKWKINRAEKNIMFANDKNK